MFVAQNTIMELIVPAKTNNKKQKPKKIEKILWKKTTLQWSAAPPVYKFLDPYQNYRLFGDMIFTNKIWQNDDIIYSFELYRDYKAMRQIHVRENGIILELEDFDEHHVASSSMIKSRMKSLGNQKASDFADFLDLYDNFFKSCNNNVTGSLSSQKPKKHIDPKLELFTWIDEVYEQHKEDLVFIRGSKILGESKDYRIQYLCYNSKMLEWITNEDNFFSEDFITSCLRIFFFRNFEEFTNILKSMITAGKQSKPDPGPKILPKYINSLIGKIEVLVEIKTKLFPEQQIFFHYFVHSKENHLPNFVQKMGLAKNSKPQLDKKQTEKQQKSTKQYSDLMKLYYLHGKK